MQQQPRELRPNRAQLELRATDLEGLLPEDHRARAVWDFVGGLDLSVLHEGIESVEGHAGRPAIDPTILLALWIYAAAGAPGHAGDRAMAAAHGDTWRKAGLPTARGNRRMCECDCAQSRAAAIPGARSEEGESRSARVRARAQCSARCGPARRRSRGSVGAGNRPPTPASKTTSQEIAGRRKHDQPRRQLRRSVSFRTSRLQKVSSVDFFSGSQLQRTALTANTGLQLLDSRMLTRRD